MIGFTGDCRDRRKNSAAPYIFPWSVIPTAGMPSRSASANSGSTLAIPSSIEYSVWLCRCTKEAFVIGEPRAVELCPSRPVVRPDRPIRLIRLHMTR
jgi:hypothetical protein